MNETHELFHQFLKFFVKDDEIVISDDCWEDFIKSFQVLYIKCIKTYCDKFNSHSNQQRHEIYNKMIKENGIQCLNLISIPCDKSQYSKFCKSKYCSFDIIPVISDLL